jgi:hypothetical protein
MYAPVSTAILADLVTPTAPITLARATRTPDRKPDRYLDGYGWWMAVDISDESVEIMELGNAYGLFCRIESCINRQEFLYEQRRQRDQRKLDKASSVERIATLRKSVERYTALAARARMGTLLIGIRRLAQAAGKGRPTIRRRLAHLEKRGFISTRVPGMQSVFDEKAGRIVRKAKGRVKPMEITFTLVPAQMRPKKGSQPMVSPRDHQNTSLRHHGDTTTLDLPKTKSPEPKKETKKIPGHPLREKKFGRKKDKDNAATPTSGLSPALGDALRLEVDPVDRGVEKLDPEGDALAELASERRQAMELGGDPASDKAKGVTYRDQWRRDQAEYDRSRLAAEDQSIETQALDSLAELRAGRSPLPPLEPDPKQVATLGLLKAQALRELGQVARRVKPKRLRTLSKKLLTPPDRTAYHQCVRVSASIETKPA